MNIKLAITTTVLILILSFTVKSVYFLSPPPIPGSKDVLHSARPISLAAAGASGPESMAFDPAGEGPYTGVSDGRILKWEGDEKGWVDFAVTSSHRKDCARPFAPHMEHICGRPLGLRFDRKSKDLYIADAYLGLQVVGPAGGLATPLVTQIEGKSLVFTNGLDIDEGDDVIYFTDTSTKFQRRQFLASTLSGDKTGRLLKYNKSTKEVTVLIQNIPFANGVALSKNGSFVLIAETTTCRITRLWLKGPNAGKSEILVNLPGFPDNIRRNSKGEFWVALHAKRGLLAKLLIGNSWLGKGVLGLPIDFKKLHFLLVGGKAHATAIKISEEGVILEVLEDLEGKTVKFISEVEERDGKLWIGSVLMPFLAVYDL